MIDNKDEIFTGTFRKKLETGLASLRSSGLSEEGAQNYFSLYKDASLSDIIKNSDLIFVEPHFGLPFYKDIIQTHTLPPTEYERQLEMFNFVVDKSYSQMPEEQKFKYDEVRGIIISIINGKKRLLDVTSVTTSADKEEALTTLTDHKYNCCGGYTDECNEFLSREDVSTVEALSYAMLLFESNQMDMDRFIYQRMVYTEDVNSSPEKYRRYVEGMVSMNYLASDPYVSHILEKCNTNVRSLVNESLSYNYKDVYDDIFTVYEEFDDVLDTVYDITKESFDDEDIGYLEKYNIVENTLYAHLKGQIFVEALCDIANIEALSSDNRNTTTMIQPVIDIFGECSTRDGINNLLVSYDQISEVVENCVEFLNGDLTQEAFRTDGNTPVTIKKSVGTIREEPKQPKLNKKEKDTDEEDPDEDDEDIEESAFTEGKISQAIQNRAMDVDKGFQKVAAAAKKSGTELSNAAKAVTRIPSQIVNGFKNKLNEWDKMDEEKRKERIMQPGYRSEIFKAMRTAIMFGATWHFSKFWAIFLFILKAILWNKADKARNNRLRNELTQEIDAELAVTEEKIQDANSAGDQKQKYQLMRLKKKLEAERVRVSANAKTI